MRRVLVLSVLAVLAACGGDGGDSGGPSEPAFPAVAGIYNVVGSFDGLSSAEGRLTGTLTLTQASRDRGDLGGTISLNARVGPDVFSNSFTLEQANVGTTGQLAFVIRNPSTSVQWTFTGQHSGNAINGGRHTITDGSTSLSGSWSATK